MRYQAFGDIRKCFRSSRSEILLSENRRSFPRRKLPVPILNQKSNKYKRFIDKSGTGGIYKINDNLFEGRYSPTNANGKREVHTVYAKTREECEKLLEEMIPKVRAKIKAEKEKLKAKNETAQG